MQNFTPEEIAAAICANAKTKKWLSCTFPMQTRSGVFSVGVKSFGLWVQIVECHGLRDGIPEQRTQKALRAEVLALLSSMVGRL